MLSGMWDLSFLTRDRTCTSCIWKRGDLTTEPPGKSLRHLVFTSRAAGRHRKHLSKKVMCILHRFSPVQLFVTLWTVAQQTPLSMGTLQARILEWVARPLLQGIFLTQESSLGHLHCRQTLYCLSHQGSPGSVEKGTKCEFRSSDSRIYFVAIFL